MKCEELSVGEEQDKRNEEEQGEGCDVGLNSEWRGRVDSCKPVFHLWRPATALQRIDSRCHLQGESCFQRYHESYKHAEIAVSYAVIHPATVVVEAVYAPVAGSTMLALVVDMSAAKSTNL